MIVELPYARNRKTGEILASEMLLIECDTQGCGSRWDSKCKHYRAHRRDGVEHKDLCRSCRNRSGLTGVKGRGKRPSISRDLRNGITRPSIVKTVCHFCGEPFERYDKQIGDVVFCSNGCRAQHNAAIRFSAFLERYPEMDDHVSYLIGMVLGDGSIRGDGPNISSVSISCDSRVIEVQDQLSEVLGDLRLPYWRSAPQRNCVAISFSLPRKVLAEIGIDFRGPKIDAQPTPRERYLMNPHLAVGLINSDGYVAVRGIRQRMVLHFSTTVESIDQAMRACLSANGIGFSTSRRRPQNPRWKECRFLAVSDQDDVKRLLGLVRIGLKSPHTIG